MVGVSIYLNLNTAVDLNFGSVEQNNAYEYVQLTGALATTSADVIDGTATLGSIVITEDSALAITLYDATSSEAVTDGTYATRVADFEATATEGTYTFDVGLTYGLYMTSIDWASFAGDWTITYRRGF
jgi:hypothetical protein